MGASVQLRPRGLQGPMYAPQRDLAYFFSPFVQEAMAGLLPEHRAPHICEAMSQLGVTDEDLAKTAEAFASAMQQIVHTDGIQTVYDALRQAGFFDIPMGARLLWLYRLGEVLTAGFFVALRDVTPRDDRTPKACGLAEMLGEARQFAAELGEKRRRRPRTSVLQATISAKEAEIEELQRLVARLQAELLLREPPAIEEQPSAQPWWRRWFWRR